MDKSSFSFDKPAKTTASTNSAVPDFMPGDKVVHRKFGEGTVVEAKAIGADMFLKVNFESVGEKNLMAAYVQLEKIN